MLCLFSVLCIGVSKSLISGARLSPEFILELTNFRNFSPDPTHFERHDRYFSTICHLAACIDKHFSAPLEKGKYKFSTPALNEGRGKNLFLAHGQN